MYILLQMYCVQRFSEVTDQLGMAILYGISGKSLYWTFLINNFNLAIAKKSIIRIHPVIPNPPLPKTSVL